MRTKPKTIFYLWSYYSSFHLRPSTLLFLWIIVWELTISTEEWSLVRKQIFLEINKLWIYFNGTIIFELRMVTKLFSLELQINVVYVLLRGIEDVNRSKSRRRRYLQPESEDWSESCQSRHLDLSPPPSPHQAAPEGREQEAVYQRVDSGGGFTEHGCKTTL